MTPGIAHAIVQRSKMKELSMDYAKKNAEFFNTWMRFASAYTQMSMAAGEVVCRRSLRLATGAMTTPEAIGMVMEKASAMIASTEKATVAAARGADALGIANAALAPYGLKTRSNVRKLRR